MDYDSYREAFFVQPSPQPRYKYGGLFGITLFMEEYKSALSFYSSVLGPPAYVEGDSTRGWKIGDFWLTLLPAASGNPQNSEMQLAMDSTEEARRLYEAFKDAGGEGEEPADVLMYEPVRLYPVSDPFGTSILIVARL
jgi:hypothetical protein